MSWLEIFAIITNIASVYYTIKNKQIQWWIGLAGIVSLIVFFYQKGLPGQVFVQLVFLIQSIQGLVAWNKPTLKIRTATKENLKWPDVVATVVTIFAALIFLILDKGKGGVVNADHASAILAMFATYMMARRFAEHWIFWMFVDFILILMFIQMGLWGMVMLYTAFIVMCVFGLIYWSREIGMQAREEMLDFY